MEMTQVPPRWAATGTKKSGKERHYQTVISQGGKNVYHGKVKTVNAKIKVSRYRGYLWYSCVTDTILCTRGMQKVSRTFTKIRFAWCFNSLAYRKGKMPLNMWEIYVIPSYDIYIKINKCYFDRCRCSVHRCMMWPGAWESKYRSFRNVMELNEK